MKNTNKILAIILAILMVVSVTPITASAAITGTAGYNITWELDKSTGILTFSGSGEMYFYTSSNTPWDTYKNYIKEVVINEGITTIGEYAFYKFYITSVTLPDSLIRIEDFAFSYCTKLTTVTIPDGVIQIDSSAFSNCTSLTSITMDKGVVFINNNAFAKCTALTDVYYSGSQQDWQLIDIRAGNDKLVNANITYAGGVSFTWEFDEETGTLTFNGTGEIPDYYNEDEGYFIKQPWEDIIKNDVKHIVINEGITDIGAYAFAYSDSLETVTMSSVVTIAHAAFYDCPALKKITTSNSLKVICDEAFCKCKKLTYIYYSGTQEEWNNVSIGDHCNDEMDKVKVYPSDYVVYSDSGTFKAITGGNTFSWTFDAYSSTLTISGEGDIGLILSLPWEQYKFDIKRLVFSDGVTSICPIVFNVLPNLIEILIPTSVIKISEQAFNSSEFLTDVYYTGTEEQWNNIVIGNDNDALLNASIHYNYHIHDYESVVTDPTCTEQGYTTYTCECGDTYVDDYLEVLGHTEETIPAAAPTCTETGLTEGSKCSVCNEAIIEQKTIETLGHTPSNAVEENYIAPTCTENGSKEVVVYCSICDEEISRETVTLEATGHEDTDNDGYCENCDEQLCNHRCHKSGFVGFIWKLINFFNRLFGLNKICECGVIHY